MVYLLEALNAFFGTELGAQDLAGAYAGVRPLISTGDPKKSVDISRKASSTRRARAGHDHRRQADHLAPHGKLAVDRIVEREEREAPCRTHEIPIRRPKTRRRCPPSPAWTTAAARAWPSAMATPPTTC